MGSDWGIIVEDGGMGREVLKGNEVCYVKGICIICILLCTYIYIYIFMYYTYIFMYIISRILI